MGSVFEARDRRSSGNWYRVFISHSSSDTWVARAIAQEIERIGAQVWLDVKNLAGGDRIAQEVLRAVNRSQEAVLVLSAASADSRWVYFEVGAFMAQHKRVTPVFDAVEPPIFWPILGLKAVALNELDGFLGELERRLPWNRTGGG